MTLSAQQLVDEWKAAGHDGEAQALAQKTMGDRQTEAQPGNEQMNQALRLPSVAATGDANADLRRATGRESKRQRTDDRL